MHVPKIAESTGRRSEDPSRPSLSKVACSSASDRSKHRVFLGYRSGPAVTHVAAHTAPPARNHVVGVELKIDLAANPTRAARENLAMVLSLSLQLGVSVTAPGPNVTDRLSGGGRYGKNGDQRRQ
jgi:hypothetical protein